MRPTKTILVADRPAGIQTIRNVMGAEFDIVSVPTFSEAELLLQTGERNFDLILCGVHFDDSRMFDLAALVQRVASASLGPLVIFRDLNSQLDAAFSVASSFQLTFLGLLDSSISST